MTIPDVSRTTRRRRRRGNRCAGWVARVCLNKICATPLPLTGSCAGLDLHTAGLPVFLFFPSFCLPRQLVRRVLCVWREDFFAIFVARMGIQFNPSPRQTRSEIFSRQGTLLTRSERADRDPFARIGTFKKARRKTSGFVTLGARCLSMRIPGLLQFGFPVMKDFFK